MDLHLSKSNHIFFSLSFHQQTNEFVHLMYSLAGFFHDMKWDFFESYHGKNICDARFSMLTRFCNDFSSSKGFENENKGIFSTESLINCIKKKQREANKNKPLSKPPTLSTQILLEFKSHPESKNIIRIKNLRSFLCFFFIRDDKNHPKKIGAQILSGENQKQYFFPISIEKVPLSPSQKLKEGFDDIKNLEEEGPWDKRTKKYFNLMEKSGKTTPPKNEYLSPQRIEELKKKETLKKRKREEALPSFDAERRKKKQKFSSQFQRNHSPFEDVSLDSISSLLTNLSLKKNTKKPQPISEKAWSLNTVYPAFSHTQKITKKLKKREKKIEKKGIEAILSSVAFSRKGINYFGTRGENPVQFSLSTTKKGGENLHSSLISLVSV